MPNGKASRNVTGVLGAGSARRPIEIATQVGHMTEGTSSGRPAQHLERKRSARNFGPTETSPVTSPGAEVAGHKT
jgi:hypothetical protein